MATERSAAIKGIMTNPPEEAIGFAQASARRHCLLTMESAIFTAIGAPFSLPAMKNSR